MPFWKVFHELIHTSPDSGRTFYEIACKLIPLASLGLLWEVWRGDGHFVVLATEIALKVYESHLVYDDCGAAVVSFEVEEFPIVGLTGCHFDTQVVRDCDVAAGHIQAVFDRGRDNNTGHGKTRVCHVKAVVA